MEVHILIQLLEVYQLIYFQVSNNTIYTFYCCYFDFKSYNFTVCLCIDIERIVKTGFQNADLNVEDYDPSMIISDLLRLEGEALSMLFIENQIKFQDLITYYMERFVLIQTLHILSLSNTQLISYLVH